MDINFLNFVLLKTYTPTWSGLFWTHIFPQFSKLIEKSTHSPFKFSMWEKCWHTCMLPGNWLMSIFVTLVFRGIKQIFLFLACVCVCVFLFFPLIFYLIFYLWFKNKNSFQTLISKVDLLVKVYEPSTMKLLILRAFVVSIKVLSLHV